MSFHIISNHSVFRGNKKSTRTYSLTVQSWGDLSVRKEDDFIILKPSCQDLSAAAPFSTKKKTDRRGEKRGFSEQHAREKE